MGPDKAVFHLLGGRRPTTPPRRLAGGRINDSYCLSDAGRSLLLQRINPAVFPAPSLVMSNLLRAVRHLREGAPRHPDGDCPWRWPEPVASVNGAWSLADTDGAHWRMLRFIPEAVSHVSVHDAASAHEMGCCLGCLHLLLADADPVDFVETLPGFHCLDRYLAQYDAVSRELPAASAEVLRWCHLQVLHGRPRAARLLEAAAAGNLGRQVVHGDPKVGNFLFSRVLPSRVLALIDFDTLMPGLLLHDLGDCLRSVANSAGESHCVSHLPLDLCRSMLAGYFSRARQILTPGDLALLPLAPWSMAYELGVRFLTDHLAADRYFQVRRRGDNLRRARAQLHLATLFAEAVEFFAQWTRDAEGYTA